MSFINYMAREINCKLVYYGPGLCGKTTNLQYIYSKTNPEAKGKMISLATETERTLFFDFLPLSLVAQRAILVVLFDTRSSLGLVRLRVKKASEELTKVFDTLVKKMSSGHAPPVLGEISDDDIDNLFND